MYYIGIDLGGTNIKAGLMDEHGKVIKNISRKTKSERGAESVVADMAGIALEVIKSAGKRREEIGGIGIGCPGTIESESGVVLYSNNLRWDNVRVVDIMKKTVGDIPVYISNDANMAALGEATFGAGREYGDSVLITLGTGVGGGIVIWDKMFEGNKSAGAEIGHMVIEVGGEECTCGRRGCFEAYSSATALIRDTRRKMTERPDSAMWKRAATLDDVDGLTAFECAKQGDEAAREVVDRYITYLGEGIVNIANVLRPEVVMLGGGVSAQGDALIVPLQKYLDTHVYGKTRTVRVLVIRATLGNTAGIIGAATLAMKKRAEEADRIKV